MSHTTGQSIAFCLLLAWAPAVQPATPAAVSEVQWLRSEVARLRAENEELRLSAPVLAASVDSAVRAGDAPGAAAAFKRLTEKFPHSKEAIYARRRVDALLAKLRAAQDEARRVAAMGFKALKSSPSFAHEDTAIGLGAPSLVKRWIFDWYGDGWRYLDAEKGSKYLTSTVTVTSKSKDPPLFGVAAYVADGPVMTQVGKLRYRFVKWRDFGSFLGNHADFRNDFSHSSRIPLSIGVSVREEDLKRGPVYLVATREGCHKRQYDRFMQPPLHYVPGNCESLKPTLTVQDFKDGTLAILKRIE